VPGADLVRSVGDHDHRPARLEPAAEVAQQVEGGVVGPVRVLQNDQCRAWGRGELGEEAAADVCRIVRFGEKGPQLRGSVVSHVTDGGERGRCGQWLGRAAQHPRVVGSPDELVDQRGLAGAGLAADQHQPPGAVDGLPPPQRKRRELGVPLDEFRAAHDRPMVDRGAGHEVVARWG
jgi:hypothetical protein